MKRYFYITIHFSPEYEGTVLARLKDDLYINTETGETYRKRALYDFGWGKENGFYKAPLPDFDTLLELVLHSEDRDDMYGAAAIILEKYADELFYRCEAMMRSAEVFRLEEPLNRCSVDQKTSEQIKSNHTRWKKIAQAAGKIR
jgi:hypothetical protein